jgi:ectoine hydroxylase-related dioxygenase (phytanoyl-CoA dioxygenase family)
MQFARNGAQHFGAALQASDLEQIEQALADVPATKPGVRLTGLAALSQALSAGGAIGRIAADRLGASARPVRALLFNKTADQNWALGWHQDRTIAVRERLETPGFSNWTIKAGIQHVEPPFELLERMLTLRVHLDPVGSTNAPLLIAPGSHRLGRIPETATAAVAERLGSFACLAAAGDIWLYATPIVHASEPAVEPRSRRVLHIDFSAEKLTGRLHWLGV